MARTNVPKVRITKAGAKLTQRTLDTIEQGRYVLSNIRATRRSAAGRSGWLGRGHFDYEAVDLDAGENLKQGVMGMADTIQEHLTQEQYNKLMEMDAGNLSALYANNKMVFEVYYDYGGVTKTAEGVHRVDASKAKDAQFLIDQYEKFFGKLPG